MGALLGGCRGQEVGDATRPVSEASPSTGVDEQMLRLVRRPFRTWTGALPALTLEVPATPAGCSFSVTLRNVDVSVGALGDSRQTWFDVNLRAQAIETPKGTCPPAASEPRQLSFSASFGPEAGAAGVTFVATEDYQVRVTVTGLFSGTAGSHAIDLRFERTAGPVPPWAVTGSVVLQPQATR